jgi:monofunctional chorismate mutase
MSVIAIRGAITVEQNDGGQIEQAAAVLLDKIMLDNNLNREDIVFIIFTSTQDLNSQYPAAGIRKAGLTEVPMLCVSEMPVTGSLTGCIRVMVMANAEVKQEVRHVYLKDAKKLRPDLSGWQNSHQE